MAEQQQASRTALQSAMISMTSDFYNHPPVCRWRNRGSETANNQPQVTQLTGGSTRMWTQLSNHRALPCNLWTRLVPSSHSPPSVLSLSFHWRNGWPLNKPNSPSSGAACWVEQGRGDWLCQPPAAGNSSWAPLPSDSGKPESTLQKWTLEA